MKHKELYFWSLQNQTRRCREENYFFADDKSDEDTEMVLDYSFDDRKSFEYQELEWESVFRDYVLVRFPKIRKNPNQFAWRLCLSSDLSLQEWKAVYFKIPHVSDMGMLMNRIFQCSRQNHNLWKQSNYLDTTGFRFPSKIWMYIELRAVIVRHTILTLFKRDIYGLIITI